MNGWFRSLTLGALITTPLAPTIAFGQEGGAPSPSTTDAPSTPTGGQGSDYFYQDPLDVAIGDPISYLVPQGRRVRARGWLDGGFIGNTQDPASKFNGPYNAVDRSNEPMFNQAYLITEAVLPSDETFGVGGRVDILYGEDFLLAQSAGVEARQNFSLKWNSQYYGIAIPQAYGEIGNSKLSLKLGHFYTIVGYESVMSPLNFFYSHSYSYQFAGPFTHWGGLAKYQWTDNVEFEGGIVNGWNALDNRTDRPNFLGKVKYTSDSKLWWTSFAVVTGDEFSNVAGLPNVANVSSNRTRYSLLAGLNPTCNIEYVFHHWYGVQNDGQPFGGAALWYGIDQYLYYRMTEKWRAGARFEWFRDDDGTRIGLNRPSNPNKPPFPGSAYSLALGLNWTPIPNVLIRPEIRADWFTGNVARQPYNDGVDDYQLMIGVDAIVKF